MSTISQAFNALTERQAEARRDMLAQHDAAVSNLKAELAGLAETEAETEAA